MRALHASLILGSLTAAAVMPVEAIAQPSRAGEQLRVTRVTSPLVIDGALDESGWREAARVDTWYETSPGDNTAPAVKSTGYLGFDDRAFYAAFEFDDPDPRAIRAPLGDHDHVSGSTTDYGGVILDTRNDGHSAVLLLASAAGIQYDAVTDDDGSGEDSAPDFFWEAAARVNEHGWTLEMRIPFSSLRYRNVDPQAWGILLYRNHPRDFRYQYFSAKLPRGGNCFICRANTLVGLERLPAGGHVVAAPYVTASRSRTANAPGAPLAGGGVEPSVGADVKWTPNADTAVDLTVNPDFSQVESDTAQISANERFALSFPEKRPFFLEGVELLSTPLKAVYTRTITSPRWGGRVTGKLRGFGYTVLATEDDGGGRAIVPGVTGSALVDQPGGSTVIIARAKRNLGRNFVGALVTDRESRNGQGWNRLAGPDFQWRPTDQDTVTGQWLFSETQVPNRPDLSGEWDGRVRNGAAAFANWNRNSTHLDSYLGYRELASGFRADAGFVPQVGYRAVTTGGGWTVRPSGLVRRERTFIHAERQLAHDGSLIQQTVEMGGGMDTRLGGFLQFRYLDDRLFSGGIIFPRRRFGYVVRFNPNRRVAQVSVDGTAGEEVDFTNARLGHGTTVNLTADVNPTDHLEFSALVSQRRLDVSAAEASGRLFTARISRLRTTYSFNAHAFARVITQYVSTTRAPALYLSAVDRRSAALTASVLLAYKVNWQSVLFLGYGDDRTTDDDHALAPTGRQVFVKMSYALQR
ncbi:MAG TPA: DUF5916 domain-containing protein [Vicinamibacterales bacterium]|nr:DUF5916 domain-containing protein [Vicinamibacterales bacterium]